jgi:hypothetical protein
VVINGGASNNTIGGTTAVARWRGEFVPGTRSTPSDKWGLAA